MELSSSSSSWLVINQSLICCSVMNMPSSGWWVMSIAACCRIMYMRYNDPLSHVRVSRYGDVIEASILIIVLPSVRGLHTIQGLGAFCTAGFVYSASIALLH